MKQTQKLITLVLLALALNAAGITVEAKNLPVSKPGKTEQTSNTAPNRELYTVTAISFSGLESLSEQELMTSLPLKIKDKITIPGTELSGALQYLWKLQLFSDIKVEKSDLGQGNIALQFMVKELPVLDEIVFKGNKKFENDELKRTVTLVTGKKINDQDLLTAVNKIEKFYASKGYLTAGAEYQLQESSKNHVKALFSITEGSKVTIEKITFHGNTAFKQNKLRSVLKETSQNSWWRKIFGAPKLDTDKFNEDKNLLVEFYRNNGYRDARIVNDTISYTRDKKGLLLDIYLEEGQKYHIGNITWSGHTKDFATTAILEKTFRIKKGDIYNPQLIQERLNYSQDNSDISSLYLDRGYLSFKANIEEKIIKPDLVDLIITMREGEQFQLNTINIKGNTKTKDHVIRRELYTIPGDMFSRKNLVRSIRELSMLNYFDPQLIAPDVSPNPENNTVDLTYNLTEKQTDTFNASVGYSSNGFTGALGVTFNNFSLQDIFSAEAYKPLPHGDGQQLGIQWQFGSDHYNTLSINFTEPWAFGGPTAVGFSAFKTHSAYDYTDDSVENPTVIDQYGTTLSIGRRLTWPDDYSSINWKLKYLNSKGGFLSFIQAPNAPDEADEYSITQTIGRNSIDSPIYPRRGSKNTISAELAGGPLPGTVDFYKFTASSSWYFPISKKFVWNISTRHGYMSTFSDSDYIPYTEYFFMGGNGMSNLPTIPLRGYDDRSLGAKLKDGSDLYAGKIYSKFTSEVRYPLSMSESVSIYALAFVEAGNLWENTQSVKFSELKKSAGLGLRLYLPIIGQIGLDYGYGFDAVESIPAKTKQGWSFMFNFGTTAE
ncbi:MAG: outer membrane protein assembly factor BamA [Chlorobiaceae bacterium]|jgi:outer membrane protein insertion porin family|nr:outer membrane protein assembly factor BamA [Chlorobiaceae bacterium]NTV16278.1 outer membrane protein assembly factor BamA [Chlorobiaceae bacterium]